MMSKSEIAPERSGPDGDDVAGGPADHVPRLLAHREDVARLLIEREDSGFREEDAPLLLIDEGVGRPQVYGQIAGHVERYPGMRSEPRRRASSRRLAASRRGGVETRADCCFALAWGGRAARWLANDALGAR